MISEKDRLLLREQGWTNPAAGYWQPPSGYKWFTEDKAIEIVTNPKFEKLLKYL